MTGAPHIMGIINVTPDSFSGDGLLPHQDYIAQALAQADQMIADGAHILDIGGESSRPGSVVVAAEEEARRVVPVIAAIRHKYPKLSIAIDTVKASVADQAIAAGATIINDINALQDPAMRNVAARRKAQVILMHNRSKPHAVLQSEKIGGHYDAPVYDDVVAEVAQDLQASIESAISAGVARDRIIVDPGIGFGKNVGQNLALIAHLDRIKQLGFPVLVGVSRKSFIGHVLDTNIEERLEGTAACVAACVLNGAAILRVHDVKFMARVAAMAGALRDA